MLSFCINEQKCTKCGQCVVDCPARIIAMVDGGVPSITPEKEINCYKCQHCLAICPTAALSILGLQPEDSQPLAGNFPAPDQLETLMKGRRSVRRYHGENLEPALLQRLLDVAWHAPTGMNARNVLFTVLDDREKVSDLRQQVMAGLGLLVQENCLPEPMAFFANFVKVWEEKQADIIFRHAPHLLIASAPAGPATPVPDCLIALTYFELFAQSLGVGTVWNGLAKWALFDLVPGMRERLGIPPDHVVGYVMTFGMPAVHYARTVQHGAALVQRVT